MNTVYFKQLNYSHIEEILKLEKKCFNKNIQVAADDLIQRFDKAHYIFGLWQSQQLIGITSLLNTNCNPADNTSFPSSFSELVRMTNRLDSATGIFYNLGIDPDYRNAATARKLIQETIMTAIRIGCLYLAGYLRPTACFEYDNNRNKNQHYNPVFAREIINYSLTGQTPKKNILLMDPYIRFLSLTTGCQPWILKKHFMPNDTTIHGTRVIVYGNKNDYLKKIYC